MSFDTLEKSRQDAQPVLLFDFLRGSDAWYYTNFPTALSARSHTYLPRAITRSTVTMGGTVPKDTIEIRLPYDDAMVAPLNAGTIGKVTTVTVWRTHADELTESQAEWLGRVAKTSRSSTVATLTCEPVFSSLQRHGIPQPYQRTCRHPYGGKGCFVNPEDYKSDLSVATVDGSKVMLVIVGTAPNFVGGVLKAADGTSQMVIDQSGSLLTLMRPIPSIESGQNVTVYLGCDRSLGTCDSVFSNAGNFGGFPGIPLINPFTITRTVF